MRRLWLLFSQFVTVLLALWFVVLTLKPQWPQDWQSLWQKWRSPAISLNTKGQSTAPLAQPVVGQSMSFRDAVKVAAPSVVSISTSRAADDPAAAKDPWFRFFFGEQGENADGEGEAQRAMGSGVIVSEQGYILTNNHVIDGAEEITVTLPDSRSTRAQIIGSDPDSDLAVLKIDLPRLAAIAWGRSDDLQVGDAVLAIGNPFGVGQTVTSGIVSGLGRNHLGINTFEDFIQTDAAINPGNSGGALVNMYGQVIGVSSAKIAATDYEGMGFAIPSATVKDVIDDIMKYGYVQGRVKIGVTGENVQSSGNTPAGIAIYSIDEDGPCANTDLKENDIITGADGKKVSNFAEFYDILESHKAGDTIELEYYRSSNGSTDKVTITLQESK